MLSAALTASALAASSSASSLMAASTAPPLAPPNRPVSVTAAASPDETAATVWWQPAANGWPASWFTISEYFEGQFIASRICFAPCSSVTARGLDPAGPGWVFKVNAGNSAGEELLATASSPVTITQGCTVASVCLGVDPFTNEGPARLRAQGFLSGIGPPKGSGSAYAHLVTALEPRWWRVQADYNSSNIATGSSYGAKVTVVLSDAWKQSHLDSTGGAEPPWDDWTKYRTWVTRYVQAIEKSGVHVAYWDIQNEPGTSSGYYNGSDIQSVTTANLLEQILVAYQAIRAADPHAAVMGPSLAVFADHPGEVDNQEPDLETLFNYCVAHDIDLAAISWHEISDIPGRTDFNVSPENIVAHVASARALLAQRPQLGSPAIVINEYGGGDVRLAPGWQVGYLSALERANVDEANRTCGPDQPDSPDLCNGPDLDGLLTPDGTETQASYWVSKFYASMSGTRTEVTTSDEGVTGFATRSSDGTVRILVGRHQSCPDAINAFCQEPPSQTPAADTVMLSVSVPTNSGPWRVTVDDVPDDTGVVRPNVVSDSVVSPASTQIPIWLAPVANGDAYMVTIAPVSSPAVPSSAVPPQA